MSGEALVDKWVTFRLCRQPILLRLSGPDVSQGARLEPPGWIAAFRARGGEREQARLQLREHLLAAIAAEQQRRQAAGQPVSGGADITQTATAIALRAIIAGLDGVTSETAPATWAAKFAMFGLSEAAGAKFWASRPQPPSHYDWRQLELRCGAIKRGGAADLAAALRGAVNELLTVSQRAIFSAVLLNDLPAEALTTGLGPSRNAIYLTLFAARRKLSAQLAGQLDHPAANQAGAGEFAGWLSGFLLADPGDTGCDLAFQALDRYAEAEAAKTGPDLRFPGVAAHLAACPACRQDYQGLLAAITSLGRPRRVSARLATRPVRPGRGSR